MRHLMPFKINIVILKTDISSAGSPTSFVLHRALPPPSAAPFSWGLTGVYPRVT